MVLTMKNPKRLEAQLKSILSNQFGTTPEMASDEQFYRALAILVRNVLAERHKAFQVRSVSSGRKQVYYMSMEFLLGRSLKNNLYNLGLQDSAKEALAAMDVDLEKLYELEPDAGLGNGGLGRLAACYMDSLAALEYPATGYSLCYEFGIFKQKIIEGWQTELVDNWLPGGQVWLTARPNEAVEVTFGGEIQEFWDKGYHHINHVGGEIVNAVPYDMYISGYGSEGVSLLRLWKAERRTLDMELFNRGDYLNALGQTSMAEVISKILYPDDTHAEGKILRLKQQYLLCCASINDIIQKHMTTYGTMDNLADKVAIQLNDTHPTLAVPELMRVLLDDCGYSWDAAWKMVTQVFNYTNHTVMSEALEQWNEDMFRILLPRVYQIVREIDRRMREDLIERFPGDYGKVEYMAVLSNHRVKMANLAVYASGHVNGVSKLHSQIIKDSVFHDFYLFTPKKFTNVTNGIAYRRWLYQSNPALCDLIGDLIGSRFLKDGSELSKLMDYVNDHAVLERVAKAKAQNKERLAAYIHDTMGIAVNTSSIFDVQVKRLHEYKRQHMNALHILAMYQYLLENPDADLPPRTFIFGAKAAPGYYMAKQIIKLIASLSSEIEKNPKIREKLRVIFLEDYKVTLSELLMPATDVSEQISLAGTEASGTGNMKMMLSGAVTIGTLDGANVEILDAVGKENFVLFGMTTPEVEALRSRGYRPDEVIRQNPLIASLLTRMEKGIDGNTFYEITGMLRSTDTYMALADFESYRDAQKQIGRLYSDQRRWQSMSLANTAASGIFSADRAIQDYAREIWNLK
jgi:starch phosphorylase